jgi:hypothetical protein
VKIVTITDWLEITITFSAKCNECDKDVLPGKALWSRSTKAAKHLSCTKIDNKAPDVSAQDTVTAPVEFVKCEPVMELKCFVRGNKTGCNECEYLTDCEQRTTSKYCICDACSKQEESFHNYKQAFVAKIMRYFK